jgi:chemotaxis signal transduction protein
MQVTLVVWDDENEASILAMGFTIEEIEDVVYNQQNDTRPSNDMDGSLQLCVTTGVAKSGRRIAVKCSFVCGNPLHVYPITAHLI